MYRFSKMHNCVYLIPSWIADTLKRHGMSMGDILNFSKIKPVLSMNDLLSLEATQRFFEQVTGVRESQSILYEWISTANDVDKLYITSQLEPLSADQFQRDTVQQRLFTESDSAPVNATPFEVVPLADLALGVIVTPGAFAGMKAHEHHLTVLRTVLKQLYVYEKHSPVAASPLYLRYLELLAQA